MFYNIYFKFTFYFKCFQTFSEKFSHFFIVESICSFHVANVRLFLFFTNSFIEWTDLNPQDTGRSSFLKSGCFRISFSSSSTRKLVTKILKIPIKNHASDG